MILPLNKSTMIMMAELYTHGKTLDQVAAAAAKPSEPAQTNTAPPEPPKSRQVLRAEARRAAKNRTSTNKRLGVE